MEKVINEVLARNIRVCARKRKIAINSLADFAGVSRSFLYEVLSSKKSPTIEWLSKVADALNVEVWQLLK